jgi:DNA repair protein RadC
MNKRKLSERSAKVNTNCSVLENHLRYIVPELRLVLLKEAGAEPRSIGCPVDLEKYVEPLKYYSEEYFVAFHLDVKRRICGYHIIAHGTLSESLVHPREVFKAAILDNTNSIIVAHNHPAGSLIPSAEDLLVTRVLIKAGAILGIGLLDHIIVSSEGVRSLREAYDHIWPKHTSCD